MTMLPLSDPLAKKISEEAKAEGVSVEELLLEMLRERQNAMDSREQWLRGDELTESLNKVYAENPHTFDPILMRMQFLSLEREEW